MSKEKDKNKKESEKPKVEIKPDLISENLQTILPPIATTEEGVTLSITKSF